MHEQIRIEKGTGIACASEEERIDLQERTSDKDPFLEALDPEKMIFQIMTVNAVSRYERTYGHDHRDQEKHKCYSVITSFQVVFHLLSYSCSETRSENDNVTSLSSPGTDTV